MFLESLKAVLTIQVLREGFYISSGRRANADFLDECIFGRYFCHTQFFSLHTHVHILCMWREIGCKLEDVLEFFSRSESVLALGFEKKPSLVFLHRASAKLPTASTCDLELKVPAKYSNYPGSHDPWVQRK